MTTTIRSIKPNEPITVAGISYRVQVLKGGPVVTYLTRGVPEVVGEDGAEYEHVNEVHVLATGHAQVRIDHE